MSARLRVLAACLGMAATTAFAGGPLAFCTGSTTPLRYTTPSSGAPVVTLNYDGGGTLGSRAKSQADTIVNNAIAMWTNVPTATITLQRGADLPVDVTAANYSTYINSSSDGLSPVVYDTDGSIVDLMLGTGAKNSVLGFAGSAGICGSSARFTEGRAVINGFIGVSDATMTNVLAHELGHLIGLDHSQLDGTQGLASSNYPLMYPIAYRTLQSLGDDDASAVTALYPGTSASATYGTLNGTFKLVDGVTAVRGANIWAKESSTGKVYSNVSDYLMQNNGAFSMLLPAGTYTLHAEAVDLQFTGGSSVGPYSDDATDPSFQAPLYSGGTAMSARTLGNATPVSFTITAGCTATATFKLDGNGSVSGCGAVTPPPPPPPPVTTTENPPRLANISTRGRVGLGSDVMIAGFIIGGTTPKTVVVRANGPSLLAQGVPSVLADPAMQVVRSADGATIATNDNWQAAANAAEILASGFAPSAPQESAVMMTLAPGAYSAIVSGVGGTTGVALVEVFEVDAPTVPLLNISTRGQVLTGSDVMIGGFIIQGSGPQTVAIRARGPSMAALGVPGTLQNPVLQLFTGQVLLAVNDDWQQDAYASVLQSSGFAPSDPREAALYVTLNPGAYSVIVTGAGGGTGVGLVELFTVN